MSYTSTNPLVFSKYTGAGNDFILLDDRDELFPIDDLSFIRSLCDRHKGVGADGVILLQCSELVGVSYRMRIFNADGSEAEMCGNGMRCLARFISDLGEPRDLFSIEVMESSLTVSLSGDSVRVDMGAPRNVLWDQCLRLADRDCEFHLLNTGVPHAVIFVDDVETVPLHLWGSALRYHEHFSPHGVNVDVAQVLENGELVMRTYERGVEGETLACGTGAVAVALAASRLYSMACSIQVRVRSGDLLQVDWDDCIEHVWMTGPAYCVFRGELAVPAKTTFSLL
ncbi:Diaminopimelate epimerase [Chlamydiales bacterium SCGC AG-110-M15]|nr:Diaminopimelate epimerase [Chlamydiales bacterium SCGC AG-110-M15]